MLTPWEIAKLLLIDDIWAGKLLPTMKPTSDVYSMQMEYSMVTYTKFRMDLIKLQNNVAKQMVLLRTHSAAFSHYRHAYPIAYKYFSSDKEWESSDWK